MSARLINRELSWLEFNRRVLALAAEPSIPLLERVKFVAICSSNLDEFFQVRVAALKDQVAGGIVKPGAGRHDARSSSSPRSPTAPGGSSPSRRRWSTIGCCRRWPSGASRSAPGTTSAVDDRKFLVGIYDQRIFPVLTPLAVDPAHPFPYISNLALNLAAMVSDPHTGERRFARVKVPNGVPPADGAARRATLRARSSR